MLNIETRRCQHQERVAETERQGQWQGEISWSQPQRPESRALNFVLEVVRSRIGSSERHAVNALESPGEPQVPSPVFFAQNPHEHEACLSGILHP